MRGNTVYEVYFAYYIHFLKYTRFLNTTRVLNDLMKCINKINKLLTTAIYDPKLDDIFIKLQYNEIQMQLRANVSDLVQQINAYNYVLQS